MLTDRDNGALVRAHFDAYSGREFDKCLEMVTDDIRWTNIPFNVAFTGKKAYRDYLQNWITAVPDAKVEVVNVVAGPEWTAVEFVGRGTHSGPFIGPRGNVPPTHRKVDLKFCKMVRVVEGHITEAQIYFDGATLMGQLGLMPQPADQPETSVR